MSEHQKIPLFPLGVVLFPEMSLPLHIFEERYKEMINECLENNTLFGVVYYTGENFYRVGCTAKIKEVIKRFDDGRMNIMVDGLQRFAIHRISNERSYLQGEIEFFDDQPEENLIELKDLSTTAVKLFESAAKTLTKSEFKPIIAKESKTISFTIAANAGFSLDEKQAFLEMTSTMERLKKASSALQRMIDRQKVTKEIEGIISGNGYLHNKKI